MKVSGLLLRVAYLPVQALGVFVFSFWYFLWVLGGADEEDFPVDYEGEGGNMSFTVKVEVDEV